MTQSVFFKLVNIKAFCEHIDESLKRHSISEASFGCDHIPYNAILFNVLKIGIFIGRLPNEFIGRNDTLRWALIRETGNKIEHDYMNLLPAEIWKIATHDIPALRSFCEQTITNTENT